MSHIEPVKNRREQVVILFNFNKTNKENINLLDGRNQRFWEDLTTQLAIKLSDILRLSEINKHLE